MLDEELRKGAKPLYELPASLLAERGVTGNALSGVSLGIGALCLVAIAFGLNILALVLWLLNRFLDGLDGELARTRKETSELGAFIDIVADFFMYGGFLIALSIQHPGARLALVVLLFAYYLNGSVFLALSGVLERLKKERLTERGLHFRRSLTEGFETFVVGVFFLVLPGYVSPIAWIFAGMVFVSSFQRLWEAWRILGQR
ncbi:MAG: CDP-alcohol phosphatidyltransferase family protein [Actinomycetota bacterium]|nr:CDP-alcohol phosphatidyltransferase family protein [Actinomycetota bacterium]